MDSIKQFPAPEGWLRIAGVVEESVVDGEGYRYSIFTQGCPHGCFGCHNPQTHAFSGGRNVSLQKLGREILENPILEGVTFSGGEPFCQAKALASLGGFLRENGMSIWCYTGYTYEKLIGCQEQSVRYLLQQLDVLVDGPYIEAQRDISLSFRGSSNQRLIDVRASLSQGRTILYNPE